jgi:hypothetical protein
MIKLYIKNSPIQNIEEVHLFPLLKKVNQVRVALVNHYCLVDTIEICDYIIIPISIEYLRSNNHTDYIKSVIDNAKIVNKKVLLFSTGDFGTSIKDQNIITIRLGGFKSKQYGKTYIMSPFVEDPYHKLNFSFNPLSKQVIPSLGFVGHSNAGIFKLAKEFLIFLKGNLLRIIKKDCTDFQAFYPSSYFRAKYLSSIQQNKQIKANFVFRKKYRAGAISAESREKTTEEFFENITQNLYTFCMRGSGNFSVRFYETLAMGRIPVLLNTDCDLPFNNQINWEKHCLIIAESETKNISQEILTFHNNHDNVALEKIQIKNRKLWLDFFQKDNYFIKLYNDLK